MTKEQVVALFWKSKGVNDPKCLSVQEKRLFVDELRAFVDGFFLGYEMSKREG